MKELRRTSHWQNLEDGLAIFFKTDRFVLQDSKDIRFHDCGDRVAQLLLLAFKPNITSATTITTTAAHNNNKNSDDNNDDDDDNNNNNKNTLLNMTSGIINTTSSSSTSITILPNQQFLCVNTHLLFPHNKASTNIRIREMSKILDFVESYRQRELCNGFYCNRSDVSVFIYSYIYVYRY
jgi:hypothetical protein